MHDDILHFDYMRLSGELHRPYWAQFVTEPHRNTARAILKQYPNPKDPHLNDIPLRIWDAYKESTRNALQRDKWQRCGCFPGTIGTDRVVFSLSDNTCILKEAARQLLEAKP